MRSYITVYESIGGWKAALIWWAPEGYWEPYSTGLGAYETREEAEREAVEWADAEDMEYKL